jgi:hypothetical protein
MSVPLLVDRIEQFAQFRHVPGRELLVFAEVREQRGELAAEHAVEQAAAFVLLPIRALQQRRVEIAPAILFRAQRAFAKQAVEQCLDGFLVPAAGCTQCRDHFLGTLRCVLPQHLHDMAFGIADGNGLGHRGSVGAITYVVDM